MSTDRRTTLLEHVRSYLKLGWSIIPLPVARKVPDADWGPWKTERPAPSQWNQWWAQREDMNLAIVFSTSEALPGRQLVCMDTDSEEAEAWVRAQRPLPPTPTVETVKGYHRYFYAPEGLGHVSPQEGMPEVRAGLHYSLVPPSVHPTGAIYTWCDALAPWEVNVADLPAWGIALMEQRRKTQPGSGVAEPGPVEIVPEGQRNERLYRKCCQWRANDVPEAQLRAAAHAWNIERCQPPLPDREVDASVDSVLKLPAGTSRQQEAHRRRAEAERAHPPGESKEASPAPDAAQERAANEQSLLAEAEAAAGGRVADASGSRRRGVVPLCDLAAEIIENVETRRLLPKKLYGMRTGWRSLDWFFGGFAWQGLILLAADSGAGKTTIARHFTFATVDANPDGPPLLVYLLEGEKEAFLRYYAGWKYGIPAHHLRPGSDEHMTDDDRELLVRAYSEFATLPVMISDGQRDAGAILADIEKHAKAGAIAGVILDNVQLLEYPASQNEWKGSKYAALRALDLCDRYRFPFLALTQINRNGRDWKERGGPEWGNNATCKLFADRGPEARREEKNRSNTTVLFNLKARHEQGCAAPLTLLGDFATGRLWEEQEYERLKAHNALRDVRTHDNE